MQTASFSGFLETICYILAFYYIIKFLARLFLPMMVKKVVEKAAGSIHQQFESQFQQNHVSNGQDEINQDNIQQKKPRESKNVGEYVDYEEIE